MLDRMSFFVMPLAYIDWRIHRFEFSNSFWQWPDIDVIADGGLHFGHV
ncbi:MAG: hypothetical protein OEW48_17425 [Phycisphaerae bacterium]|nr:hypothetical protein [Phycisphaerae bacterium]